MRLFVTDLDGTLLNHGKTIEPQDEDAISGLLARGVEVCFASGRSDGDIAFIAGWFDGAIHRISHNGAIVRRKDGALLGTETFELDTAAAIDELVHRYEGLVVFTGDREGEVWLRESDARTRPYEERLYVRVRVRDGAPNDIGRTLVPGKFSIFGETDLLRRVERDVMERFGGSVDSFRSDVDCVDFMPKGVSKGTGLERLLAAIGGAPERTACVGDSHNDIAMLAMTPFGFAMSHAHADVRRSAAHGATSVADVVARLGW